MSEAADAKKPPDLTQYLITQSTQVAQIYDDRRKDADTASAALLLASVGLATVAAFGLKVSNPTASGWKPAAVVVLAAALISAIAAAWARWEAGLRWRRSSVRQRRFVGATENEVSEAAAGWPAKPEGRPATRLVASRESDQFREARDLLDRVCQLSVTDLVGEAVLVLWKERETDLHYIARRKERWIAFAGFAFLVAVLAAAVAGAIVVLN